MYSRWRCTTPPISTWATGPTPPGLSNGGDIPTVVTEKRWENDGKMMITLMRSQLASPLKKWGVFICLNWTKPLNFRHTHFLRNHVVRKIHNRSKIYHQEIGKIAEFLDGSLKNMSSDCRALHINFSKLNAMVDPYWTPQFSAEEKPTKMPCIGQCILQCSRNSFAEDAYAQVCGVFAGNSEAS